jgi:hypothetical protein
LELSIAPDELPPPISSILPGNNIDPGSFVTPGPMDFAKDFDIIPQIIVDCDSWLG